MELFQIRFNWMVRLTNAHCTALCQSISQMYALPTCTRVCLLVGLQLGGRARSAGVTFVTCRANARNANNRPLFGQQYQHPQNKQEPPLGGGGICLSAPSTTYLKISQPQNAVASRFYHCHECGARSYECLLKSFCPYIDWLNNTLTGQLGFQPF